MVSLETNFEFRSPLPDPFPPASYWRIRGRADEAIRCLRRSLRLAPRHRSHYPLLALANVLHRSRRSEDALIILQHALSLASELEPSTGASVAMHFTKGNVHATLMQLEE